MPTIILFDSNASLALRPLTSTRAVADCRVGITTLRQKWETFCSTKICVLPQAHLAELYTPIPQDHDYIYINGAILPNKLLWSTIEALDSQEAIWQHGQIIAFTSNTPLIQASIAAQISDYHRLDYEYEVDLLRYPEDILRLQEKYLRLDYEEVTAGRRSAAIDPSTFVRGQDVFVEDNTRLYNAILNAEDGPIYIGAGCEVMEGAVIKGPVAIGAGTKVHVGAKIYGNTVFGPECRVGGEIKRTCFLGYSNKGHEGYLGDSIIGEWCNMGADTNCSNMKNTYGEVSWWDISQAKYRNTGRQFCGVLMGDHTMCAIDTAFSTGSVTGIGANIFGGNPHRYTPSFSWGVNGERFELNKFIEIAGRAMSRRHIPLSPAYEKVLRLLYDQES